jgi:uncharacterized protein YkwD
MKTTHLALLLVTLSLLGACGKSNKSGQSSSPSLTPVQTEDEVVSEGSKQTILKQLNKYRQAAGSTALRYDATLDNYAQGHAENVSDGRTPLSTRQCTLRNSSTGIHSSCAEFVLRGQFSSQDVVKQLTDAPRNQARLQDPALTRIGIGSSLDRQGRAVWVLLMISTR